MMKMFSKKIAGSVLIISLIFLVIFHFLVAIRVWPGDIVWGGTISGEDIVVYETVALLITGVLLLISIIKAGYVKNRILTKTANVLIWIMVFYFLFMIFGNLAAKSLTEKVIFIPLSILMFVSSLRLALKN